MNCSRSIGKRRQCTLPADTSGVCILHCAARGKSPAIFMEAILNVAEGADYPLTGLHFPADFSVPEMLGLLRSSRLSLANSVFHCRVVLDRREVVTGLVFTFTQFRAPVSAATAVFSGGSVVFAGCQFSELDFANAGFKCPVVFDTCSFAEAASFNHCTFDVTTFRSVTFGARADFAAAEFRGPALFEGLSLSASIEYSGARILDTFEFRQVFCGSAETTCHVSFRSVDVVGRLVVRRLYPSSSLVLDLSHVVTERGRVLLRDTNMSTTSLHASDLSRVMFLSCTWPIYRGRFACFDDLAGENTAGLEDQYRELRRAYERSGHLLEASDFYFREMDAARMKLGPLSRHFSLLALYGLISSYGESYLRATAMLIGLWVLATLAFAVALPLRPGSGVVEGVARGARVATQAMMFAPVGEAKRAVGGEILVALFRLLSAAQSAFVALAVRRRFRR
jgi:uncharacterized protein YjbI with pentapeptide repeats